MELGGLWWTNVLTLALPLQRHRPATQPEHQDPVIHRLRIKGRKKERKKGKINKENKVIKIKNKNNY